MAVRTEDLRGQLARHARTWRGCWQSWRRPHALYLSCPDASLTPADDAQAWQAPLDALDAWCAQHPGARCELALSSAATLWHVAPLDAGDRTALPAAWEDAFAQWAHYMDVDLNQPEVLARWQLQEAPTEGFTLLAATPLALSAGLQDVAARHGVQLLWLGPWWVRGLACWLQALRKATHVEHGTDAIAPWAQLHLAEPGWAWAAQAQPMPQPSSRLQRRWGRPAWRLTQLSWSPLVAARGPTVAAAHDVTLAVGDGLIHPDQATCHPVDLAVLRGEAPIWSPA
jgi:hypothetical protein